MKFFRVQILIFFILSSCNSSQKLLNTSHPKNKVYFSENEVEYQAYILKYSALMNNNSLKDENQKIDSIAFQKIKKLNIFPSNSMNFINSYNDTINVVFSLPKRDCLRNALSDYLFNFSTTNQYLLIYTKNKFKIDSMQISHETRIVPPIDCATQKDLILDESK